MTPEQTNCATSYQFWADKAKTAIERARAELNSPDWVEPDHHQSRDAIHQAYLWLNELARKAPEVRTLEDSESIASSQAAIDRLGRASVMMDESAQILDRNGHGAMAFRVSMLNQELLIDPAVGAGVRKYLREIEEAENLLEVSVSLSDEQRDRIVEMGQILGVGSTGELLLRAVGILDFAMESRAQGRIWFMRERGQDLEFNPLDPGKFMESVLRPDGPGAQETRGQEWENVPPPEGMSWAELARQYDAELVHRTESGLNWLRTSEPGIVTELVHMMDSEGPEAMARTIGIMARDSRYGEWVLRLGGLGLLFLLRSEVEGRDGVQQDPGPVLDPDRPGFGAQKLKEAMKAALKWAMESPEQVLEEFMDSAKSAPRPQDLMGLDHDGVREHFTRMGILMLVNFLDRATGAQA